MPRFINSHLLKIFLTFVIIYFSANSVIYASSPCGKFFSDPILDFPKIKATGTDRIHIVEELTQKGYSADISNRVAQFASEKVIAALLSMSKPQRFYRGVYTLPEDVSPVFVGYEGQLYVASENLRSYAYGFFIGIGSSNHAGEPNVAKKLIDEMKIDWHGAFLEFEFPPELVQNSVVDRSIVLNDFLFVSNIKTFDLRRIANGEMNATRTFRLEEFFDEFHSGVDHSLLLQLSRSDKKSPTYFNQLLEKRYLERGDYEVHQITRLVIQELYEVTSLAIEYRNRVGALKYQPLVFLKDTGLNEIKNVLKSMDLSIEENSVIYSQNGARIQVGIRSTANPIQLSSGPYLLYDLQSPTGYKIALTADDSGNRRIIFQPAPDG